MQELVYALRFRGEGKHIGIDGSILKMAASAPGCTINSLVGSDGLDGSLHTASGCEATFESEMVFTGATSFQEAGTIRFGLGGHLLRFSTVGSAFLGPASDGRHRHGAAIWRVNGGEGQFASATGLIASIFALSDSGEVTDHLLGVVCVR